ncbi:hypothetical protein GCM10009016_22410 [Halomonas beimenensis]
MAPACSASTAQKITKPMTSTLEAMVTVGLRPLNRPLSERMASLSVVIDSGDVGEGPGVARCEGWGLHGAGAKHFLSSMHEVFSRIELTITPQGESRLGMIA